MFKGTRGGDRESGSCSVGRRVRPPPAAWLFLLLAFAVPLHAQHQADLISLPAEGVVGGLKQYAAVRADPEGELDPSALLASDAGFQPYTAALEHEAPPLWLKFRVSTPPEGDGDYVLRVARRFFRQFQLYVPQPDGSVEQFQAAFDAAVTMETAGRQYAAGFRLEPGQVQTLLIRVETVQKSLQPLELWIESEASFSASKSTSALLLGLLFGILTALIFQNFILYLNLRQRGHLFYVLAMLNILLLLGVDAGLLQNYLLPDFLQAHVTSIYIMLSPLALLTIGLFFLAFVNPQRHAPRLSRVIYVLLGLLAAFAVATPLLPDHRLPLLLTLQQPVQFLFQILLIVGAVMAGRRGATEGYIFLAAWLVFIISGFARVFMSLDLVPRNNIFEYLIYVGAVVEAGILALGLTWRVRDLYRRHARAIEEQHRVSRLANLDSLTEAYNRRFLKNYLESVLPDDSFDRAVLILDLDNFKAANDEHGHAAGDLVLREFVQRCQEMLRKGDVLCRLGGDEFVIVLSDQRDRAGLEVARRIIDAVARRPFVFESAEMPITTSIGVVSSISPTAGVSDILRMADQALYQAKRAGRNRAVVFDPDRATPFRRGPSRMPATET